jgi:proteasome lid subunit RPN8/RPN11
VAVTDDPISIDAALIKPDASPPRPLGRFGGKRRRGFQVVFARAALDAVTRHGSSRTDAEVGGVLLGQLCHDDDGAYLLVTHAVPALAASEGSTSVTFTGEAWSRIHEQIETNHPGGLIVGWYHTHPNFGVFLSEMDVFIHRSFFDQPFMIATVFDPIRSDIGTFVWRRGEPTREATLTEVEPHNPSSPTALPVTDAPVKTKQPKPKKPDRRRKVHRNDHAVAPASTTVRRNVNAALDHVGRMTGRQRLALFAFIFLVVFILLSAVLVYSRPARSGPANPTLESSPR